MTSTLFFQTENGQEKVEITELENGATHIEWHTIKLEFQKEEKEQLNNACVELINKLCNTIENKQGTRPNETYKIEKVKPLRNKGWDLQVGKKKIRVNEEGEITKEKTKRIFTPYTALKYLAEAIKENTPVTKNNKETILGFSIQLNKQPKQKDRLLKKWEQNRIAPHPDYTIELRNHGITVWMDIQIKSIHQNTKEELETDISRFLEKGRILIPCRPYRSKKLMKKLLSKIPELNTNIS